MKALLRPICWLRGHDWLEAKPWNAGDIVEPPESILWPLRGSRPALRCFPCRRCDLDPINYPVEKHWARVLAELGALIAEGKRIQRRLDDAKELDWLDGPSEYDPARGA